MISGVEYVARTFTEMGIDDDGEVMPYIFSLRKKDGACLSVREMKRGWKEFSIEFYNNLRRTRPCMPNLVGYAQLEIAEVENYASEEFRFEVLEDPPKNKSYHAGIFTYNQIDSMIYAQGAKSVPEGAAEVIDAPGLMAMNALLGMSEIKSF